MYNMAKIMRKNAIIVQAIKSIFLNVSHLYFKYSVLESQPSFHFLAMSIFVLSMKHVDSFAWGPKWLNKQTN